MKFFGLVALALMSLPAFSQTCYVDMIQKNSGRVVRSFTAYGDPSSCVEGMKECRKSIRFDYSTNPQFPASSLDCVRAGNYNPTPSQPPYNPPQNPPYNPPHNPGSYQNIEVNSLILDITQNVSKFEGKTKITEAVVASVGSYRLSPLVSVCKSTSTWEQNAACLLDGVRRAQRELIDENSAINAVARACVITTSWQDEASCFSQSLRGNRLPSLSYLAPSCQQMSGLENQSRCFRQVFGVR